MIRKCKEQFHQDQQADDELAASIVLIDALLAESKLPEAESEAGNAKQLADKSANTPFAVRNDVWSRARLFRPFPSGKRTTTEDTSKRSFSSAFGA